MPGSKISVNFIMHKLLWIIIDKMMLGEPGGHWWAIMYIKIVFVYGTLILCHVLIIIWHLTNNSLASESL